MPCNAYVRAVASTACVSLMVGPLPARAEETIRCSSRGFDYSYCRADTDDRVELVRQISLIDCRQGRSWGYDRRGVWVDHGCSAEFKVGRRDDRHGSNAAAGVALVGLAALVALAASKKKEEEKRKQQQSEDDLASWMVGSFSAWDDIERADVQLTVVPGGALNGRAGRNNFTGNVKGQRMEAGRYAFRIERAGNGFIATDERDAAHRVTFRRTAGGY